MAGFVERVDRGQSTLFPALLDDYLCACWSMALGAAGINRAGKVALVQSVLPLARSNSISYSIDVTRFPPGRRCTAIGPNIGPNTGPTWAIAPGGP
jgi:hypothetical protein